MEATPGKGLIVKPEDALVKEEPGIMSQLFIGFFWYYLACGCVWPTMVWFWEKKKGIALYITVPTVVYIINQPFVVPMANFLSAINPEIPPSDWVSGNILVILFEIFIIYILGGMIDAGKKELERRRIEGKK